MPSIRYSMYHSALKASGAKQMLCTEDKKRRMILREIQGSSRLALPEGVIQGVQCSVRKIGDVQTEVMRKKGSSPQRAILYLFGGGFALPPDRGDLSFCRDFVKNTDSEVWMPMLPIAPDADLNDIICAALPVY